VATEEPDARPSAQKAASRLCCKRESPALISFALLIQKAGATVPPLLGAGREAGLGSLSKFQLENKPAQLPVRAYTLAFLTRLFASVLRLFSTRTISQSHNACPFWTFRIWTLLSGTLSSRRRPNFHLREGSTDLTEYASFEGS
jgi:hypothetical protein